MRYVVNLSRQAITDSEKLEKNAPKAFKKLIGFLSELEEHPCTGTEHPEPLKRRFYR